MPAPITPTRRAALAAIIRLPRYRPIDPRPEWRPGEVPATGDAGARRMAAGAYPIDNRSAVSLGCCSPAFRAEASAPLKRRGAGALARPGRNLSGRAADGEIHLVTFAG
jgi:hypothetical protein